MTDSSVKVQPSTGTGDPQVATEILPDGTQAQKIEIVDASDNKAGVSAAGALRVDGSGVTQPVSLAGGISVNNGTAASAVNIQDGGNSITVDGAVTANVGATNGLALDATLTGGAQKTKLIDSGGTNAATVSAAGALKVDGSAVTQPVSLAGNQAVNVAQIAGTAADTNSGNKSAGTQRIVIATDQPQLANALKVDGSAVTQPVSGTLSVNALPAGSNTIGNVGLAPQTSGGCSISRTLSAASTNATSVKASAGQVFGVRAFNANAATRYFKLYNKASAPTVGTDTPVDTIPLPSGVTTGFMLDCGVAFGTGIALALTTGIADSDTGAVGANDVVVAIFYK